MSELILTPNMPWHQPWPADELERVAACPICGSAERTVLHEHLVDNVFFAAPGKWTLHSCNQCGGAYLDPRPNAETIHRAYTNYYTHREARSRDDYASLSPFRKLRRRLVNGYTNWRFGTQSAPASILGVLAVFVIPKVKRALDCEYRHLPRLPKGGGMLLDVGCGDGSFLRLANTCGWNVVGLDPDPKAVVNAAGMGITVHEGGIDKFNADSNLFDVITLNHVIEHVRDPIKLLRSAHRLLKPGGTLYVETPNRGSFGAQMFGESWRGLEPPRHLVIFNQESLRIALRSVGFGPPLFIARPGITQGLFWQSENLRRGQPPLTPPGSPHKLAILLDLLSVIMRQRHEFLTILVTKPV